MADKLTNQIPPDLRRLYIKAAEAAQRDNPDYAITLFCDILAKEPGYFDCRRALRVEQAKKAAAQTTGFFKKAFSGMGSSPQIAKAKMALGKNPAEAMATAEQVLNSDPNNSMAHRIIVDAALALDFPKTAVMSLEVMVRNSPKDKALVVEFADLAAQTGGEASASAEAALDELARASGFDPDLAQAQKNLSARKTMDEGGYSKAADGKGSFRDMLKDKAESVSLEQASRVQRSEDVGAKLIAEYEARLPAEPDNMKMIRSLGDLYIEKKRYDDGLAMYERIKNSVHGSADAALDRIIAEAKIKKMDFGLAQLNPFEADHVDQIARIKAEKADFKLVECKQRVEKYPTDMAIRFEYGQLLFEAGKIGEAIPELQKAQQNPHKRIAAMSYLAQCFAKRGINDSAVRTFQNAIKEKPGFDDEKKDLVYNLGCVYEKMGKKNEALEQFLQIFESDAGYRDVAAKVDAFYGSQGGDAAAT